MKKKPEMVRRNKIVKFAIFQSQLYSRIAASGDASDGYLRGLAVSLNDLCEEFDITPDELGEVQTIE